MENTQGNMQQKEPEWEPIEDGPPKPGFFEKVVMPGVFLLGVLYLLAAIIDVVFFNFVSHDQQIGIGFAGLIFIMLWAADKVMRVI